MLSENIKAMRESRGLSQEELAVKLNVVRQTVSKWERGRSVPDADMLMRLSEELGASVSALLGETAPEGAPDTDGLHAISQKLEVVNHQLALGAERRRRAVLVLCAMVFAATVAVLGCLVAMGGWIPRLGSERPRDGRGRHHAPWARMDRRQGVPSPSSWGDGRVLPCMAKRVSAAAGCKGERQPPPPSTPYSMPLLRARSDDRLPRLP